MKPYLLGPESQDSGFFHGMKVLIHKGLIFFKDFNQGLYGAKCLIHRQKYTVDELCVSKKPGLHRFVK